MDTKERVLKVGTAEQAGSDLQQQQQKKQWYRYFLSPLWVCLLIALLLRVWLVVRTNGFIDGDEALVGIQAEHILHGEIPFYFYGIPYFGSLEAYLAALIFAITGPSVWALRAEPTLVSLLLVGLTWRFASLLAEVAKLPLYARKYFVISATLLAAVPPLYDGVIELRTFGGYIEIFVLMLLLLISALQLTRRWRAATSWRELALRWAGIGFIVGFGMWVYPLIVSAILASALWIIANAVIGLISRRSGGGTFTSRYFGERNKLPGSLVGAGVERMRGGDACVARVQFPQSTPPIAAGDASVPSPLNPTPAPTDDAASHTGSQRPGIVKGLLLAVAAIPTAMIGFTPGIIWGASHQWANIAYIVNLGGGGISRARLSTIRHVASVYTSCIAPRVISGVLPIESKVMASVHTPLLMAGVFCIAATAALVGLSFLWHAPALLRVQQLAALPLLFGICTAISFVAGRNSVNVLAGPCTYDPVGRYATPLLLVLPFFFAAIFTVCSMFLHERQEQDTQAATANAASPQSPQPRFSSIATRFHLSLLAQALLFALIVVYLGAQAWTYGQTDAEYTFQSPFCPQAPTNNDNIIAYLQQQHVHYAWASNWIAYAIDFKTNGSIIVVDPLPFIPPVVNIDRFPANTNAVRHADRPALLVFVHHDDAYPRLLQALDNASVTYTAARFPASGGSDVLVVTNLSRTVSPFESAAFEGSFSACYG